MTQTENEGAKPWAWKKLFGWLLIGLGVGERLLDWIGNIDLLVTRSNDPGWIGSVLNWLGSNSPIWGSLSILLGFFLVIRSERRLSEERYIGRDEIDAYVGRQVRDTLNAGELVLDGGTFDDPVLGSALYCYAPSISLNGLSETFRFEIAIIAFNGYDTGGQLRRVTGHVTARGRTNGSQETELVLQTPSIVPGRSPENYTARSEFMVVLWQAVTPVELQSIQEMLHNGTATFDMRELRVEIDLETDRPRTEQLAISRSPNVRLTASGDFIYNHTIFLSVNSVVGA